MRSRILRRLWVDQRGIALVVSLGVLLVLSVSVGTVVYASTANLKSSTRDTSRQLAYSLAEAGINNALAILNNALDPRQANLVPLTVVAHEGGTATFSAAISGDYLWTITSTGRTNSPVAERTLTRTVQVVGINEGATVGAWSRMFHNSTTTCLTISTVTIPFPVASRGDLCLTNGGKITGAASSVDVGDDITLSSTSTIGTSGTRVAEANVGDTCKWSTAAAHKPCGDVDRVYATTVTTTPEDLVMPTIDLNYWWEHAKPGPKHPCNNPGGSFPNLFDNDAGSTTGPNNSLSSAAEITPTGSSYTCQVLDAQGNIEGELSWNHVTKVLTVQGTIYRDGDFRWDDDGQIVHYHGRGIIYATDDVEFDEVVCAGGTGNESCITNGMQNWDPTQNMLTVLAGDDSEFDQGGSTNNPGGLQGIVYAKGTCEIHEKFHHSGPVICDRVYLPSADGDWPTYYTWPPLGSLVDGQVYASTATATAFELQLGPQSG